MMTHQVQFHSFKLQMKVSCMTKQASQKVTTFWEKKKLPELFSHVVPCSIFRGIISSLYNVQEVLGTEWSTFGITRENVWLFDLMFQILASTAYGVSEQSGGKCLVVMFVCTYHPPLPDNTHPVLDSGHSVRDLCEVLFAQSSLLDAEGTMLRRHDAQSVTGNRAFMFSKTQNLKTISVKLSDLSTVHVLSQQAHQVSRRVGVDA